MMRVDDTLAEVFRTMCGKKPSLSKEGQARQHFVNR